MDTEDFVRWISNIDPSLGKYVLNNKFSGRDLPKIIIEIKKINPGNWKIIRQKLLISLIFGDRKR